MELLPHLSSHQIILASGSPRRKELLESTGIDFTVEVRPTNETWPPELQEGAIAEYLAHAKSEAFATDLKQNQLIITADTIVCIDGEVLNKPADEAEATQMLQKLSNRTHKVITGVCLRTTKKATVFHTITRVHFHPLTDAEISYYITHYKPFDKAGSYGIQEWIGQIGIQDIEGDYFNVVGLPVQRLWQELKLF